VFVLIDVKWSTDPLGLFWATLNAALFVGYIILGHRAAKGGASGGVDRLGAAMLISFVILMPIGFVEALRAFEHVELILAGIAVGVCSSVIPYVCDQLAMSRLPRASFALMLALLPATATIIAAIVLAQIPSQQDLAGIALVMIGIAIHRPAPVSEGE
jgi:inner membrane transporter RhtA